MRPIGVDLFAGAGGLSLGFERAGFDIAAAIDIDPVHCATHQFNFPYCSTICRDVAEVRAADIREETKIGNADIAVVFGGAPCQGFSLIGKRAVQDPRNKLVHHFVRLVHELQPAYFVFENVKGLTVGNQRHILSSMIKNLDPGYHVVLPYKVLNAADFGVPQVRHRLFLLGARKDHALPQYPRPKDRRVTVAEALDDLPEPEEFEELKRGDWVVAEYGEPSAYARKMRGLSNDAADFGYRRVFEPNIVTSSLRTKHSAKCRTRFMATPQGKTEPISRFHKLDPDGLSNTIRAGTASDRGALTSPRPIHPYSPRVITNREGARLHSYPDWFRFHVTKWHGFRQIGNSVPPLLAQAIAREIIRALEHSPSVPTKTLTLGDAELLSLCMTRAARLYGVSNDVVPKRQRRSSVANPREVRAAA